MKNSQIIFTFFYFLIFLLSTMKGGGREVNRNNDFQLWLDYIFKKNISEKEKWYLESQFRYGGDASKLYFYYIQSRYLFSPAKWLDLGPGYRQAFSFRRQEGKWRPIYNPFFDIHFKFDPSKMWSITDRNRYQYFEGAEDEAHWQYRNRLQGIASFSVGKLYPMVSNEVFFREHIGFFENRLALGLTTPTSSALQFFFQYMLRNQRAGDIWRRHHILWLNLEFTF